MSNEQIELISRNTYRRMLRKFKKDMLYTIKILSLWFLCALAVFMVAVAFEYAELPNTLFWMVIEFIAVASAAVVSVTQVNDYIEKTKRGGQIERKNSRICTRHKDS